MGAPYTTFGGRDFMKSLLLILHKTPHTLVTANTHFPRVSTRPMRGPYRDGPASEWNIRHLGYLLLSVQNQGYL